jgi:hypothetical protein
MTARTRRALHASLVVSVLAWGLAMGACAPHGAAPSAPRAAIVDQLAATDRNPAFVEDATRQLTEQGYHVDYYPPEAVTVDLYRRLPAMHYDLLILRSHASAFVGQPRAGVADTLSGHWAPSIFTNEPYSVAKYVDEQRLSHLIIESYTDQPITQTFFGITADFIAYDTQGRFDGTTVILMGCGGPASDQLASAFKARGAEHFVAWDSSVSAQHTDEVTDRLLSALVVSHRSVPVAVAYVMQQLGPDPAFGSKLVAFN